MMMLPFVLLAVLAPTKRVRLVVQYSGGMQHAPQIFTRIKHIVKTGYPDVVVEKKIRAVTSPRDTDRFEVLVDGRLEPLSDTPTTSLVFGLGSTSLTLVLSVGKPNAQKAA